MRTVLFSVTMALALSLGGCVDPQSEVATPGGDAIAARPGLIRVIARVRVGDEAVSAPAQAVAPGQPAVAPYAPPYAPAYAPASVDAAKARVVALMRERGAVLVKPLPDLPFVVLEVDQAGLQQLLASGLVIDVQEDVAVPPTLPQSGPLIGADTAWALGARGGGRAVAILDTGVDATHPFLAGRIVAEACFSSNSVTMSAATVCPNGQTQQIGPGAAVPCALPACDHGTHVAGIAAGRGTAFSGIAPDANIVPIQVFSLITDVPGGSTPCATLMVTSPCLLSFASDQLQALAFVQAQAQAQNISAANLSLGGGQFTAACDTDVRVPIIQALRTIGVATVIASGNSSFTSAVGSPACISSAVTVGATDKLDAVASFSNSSTLVDLLAPGVSIQSSVTGTGFNTKNGTSMAAPHVAGAFAVLASSLANAPTNELEGLLKSTGVAVTDTRNNLTIPRVNLGTAFSCLKSPPHLPVGLYRPGTGTIWLLTKDGAGDFLPFYQQGEPGAGIGGYDLLSPADRLFWFDYAGTGKADHLVLYRPGTGTIWILGNTCSGFPPLYQQGEPGNGIGGYNLTSTADQAFAYDFDGSGKRDHIALYRPGTGTFWIVRKDAAGNFTPVYNEGDPGAGIGGFNLLSPADRAFAFDFDSNGNMDDIVLYRPGTGTIWILSKNSAGAFVPVFAQGDPGLGIGGFDLKSPADRVIAYDYDSSGRMDHLLVYRPGTGTVWILGKNAAGAWSPVYAQGDPGLGIGGYDLKSADDRIVAVDFDGSGKFDHLALSRPGTGTIWILRKNADGTFTPVYQQGEPGNGIGGYDLKSAADVVFAPSGG